MKYSILINQKSFFESFGESLDITDAALFSFVFDFLGTGIASKVTEGGIDYFWISHKLVIREMPILKLKTKDAVYRRMRKLAQAGLIERNPDASTKPHYRIGKDALPMFFSVERRESIRGVGDSSEGGSEIHPPLVYKDQTTSDQIKGETPLKSPKIEKFTKQEAALRFFAKLGDSFKNHDQFPILLGEFLGERWNMRKPMTIVAVNRMLNSWEGFEIEEICEGLTVAINGRYQGVFPRKGKKEETISAEAEERLKEHGQKHSEEELDSFFNED